MCHHLRSHSKPLARWLRAWCKAADIVFRFREGWPNTATRAACGQMYSRGPTNTMNHKRASSPVLRRLKLSKYQFCVLRFSGSLFRAHIGVCLPSPSLWTVLDQPVMSSFILNVHDCSCRFIHAAATDGQTHTLSTAASPPQICLISAASKIVTFVGKIATYWEWEHSLLLSGVSWWDLPTRPLKPKGQLPRCSHTVVQPSGVAVMRQTREPLPLTSS